MVSRKKEIHSLAAIQIMCIKMYSYDCYNIGWIERKKSLAENLFSAYMCFCLIINACDIQVYSLDVISSTQTICRCGNVPKSDQPGTFLFRTKRSAARIRAILHFSYVHLIRFTWFWDVSPAISFEIFSFVGIKRSEYAADIEIQHQNSTLFLLKKCFRDSFVKIMRPTLKLNEVDLNSIYWNTDKYSLRFNENIFEYIKWRRLQNDKYLFNKQTVNR